MLQLRCLPQGLLLLLRLLMTLWPPVPQASLLLPVPSSVLLPVDLCDRMPALLLLLLLLAPIHHQVQLGCQRPAVHQNLQLGAECRGNRCRPGRAGQLALPQA
jgi:hypothetical protein